MDTKQLIIMNRFNINNFGMVWLVLTLIAIVAIGFAIKMQNALAIIVTFIGLIISIIMLLFTGLKTPEEIAEEQKEADALLSVGEKALEAQKEQNDNILKEFEERLNNDLQKQRTQSENELKGARTKTDGHNKEVFAQMDATVEKLKEQVELSRELRQALSDGRKEDAAKIMERIKGLSKQK